MVKTSFAMHMPDPLYGIIDITDKEKQVIQTKTFQRLKNIKQLGTANFVYPGANHSRYEHSIGVMHATSLILDRLNIGQDHKQSIRIAALLHDIGHGPFSHSFEEILVRNPQYRPSLDGNVLKDHEEFSGYILSHDPEIRSALGSDLEEISNFLSGTKSIGDIPPEIVTGDIGSDRIDYLIRDTYYTGLGHRPDINSLISNMKLSKNKEFPRIMITEEGILAAELLITTRYYHFSMIANNPKTRAVELLFIKLIEAILKKEPNPQDFVLQAHTKYDDSIILNKIFNSEGSLRDLFYCGKGLDELYNISLNEVRSGLAKYFIYRFFYDKEGLKDYEAKVEDGIKKNMSLDKTTVDIHLFKHDVPDIILCREKYKTKKDWISPFVVDHSHILRLIPGEQLLRSSIRILNEEEFEDKEGLWQKIDDIRSVFLSTKFLAPFLKERVSKEFNEVDYFYTFLCALRDFYSEKPWKFQEKQEVIFRGIGRFYALAKVCCEELHIKIFPLQEFCEEEGNKFDYSVKGFSMLNSFAVLEFLRLDYIPVDRDILAGKPYHKVYVIKPMERAIRKQFYEGTPKFEKLKNEFVEIFRKLDWKDYFEEFFPLKSNN